MVSVENPDKEGVQLSLPVTKLIAKSIIAWNVDIAGIMEVLAGQGNYIAMLVTQVLNSMSPGAGYTWKSTVSSQQNSSRREETLYFWKDQAGFIKPSTTTVPGPFSLISVVDTQGWTNLFTQLGLAAPTDQESLLATLAGPDNLILTELPAASTDTNTVYSVDPAHWTTLNEDLQSGTGITFTLTAGSTNVQALTSPQQQAIGAALVTANIMSFPIDTERAPYVADFLLGSDAAPLRIALLHTPGPKSSQRSTNTPGAANNIVGLTATAPDASGVAAFTGGMLSTALAPNVLYMGDFNVTLDQINLPLDVPAYGWFTDAGSTEFGLSGDDDVAVFSTVTGAPMNAARQIPNALTSLTSSYLSSETPYATLVTQSGANPYDNFYFRGSGGADAITVAANPAPSLREVMIEITPATNLPPRTGTDADPNFNNALAARYMKFYVFRKGGVDALSAALANIGALEEADDGILEGAMATLENAQQNAAAGSEEATTSTGKRLRASLDYVASRKKIRDTKSDDVAALKSLKDIVQDPSKLTPLGYADAFLYYRRAVSDHLPIIITVND